MSCKAILAEDIPFLLSYCMAEYLRKFIHIHIPDYDVKEKKTIQSLYIMQLRVLDHYIKKF